MVVQHFYYYCGFMFTITATCCVANCCTQTKETIENTSMLPGICLFLKFFLSCGLRSTPKASPPSLRKGSPPTSQNSPPFINHAFWMFSIENSNPFIYSKIKLLKTIQLFHFKTIHWKHRLVNNCSLSLLDMVLKWLFSYCFLYSNLWNL